MKTYLLLWVPTGYKKLYHEYTQWTANTWSGRSWSTGVMETIAVGSRVFIMRITDSPKGIIASGKMARPGFKRPNPHDPEKIDNMQEVVFDVFGDPDKPLLRLSELLEIRKENIFWVPRSARSIDEVAPQLEQEWSKAVTAAGLTPRPYPLN